MAKKRAASGSTTGALSHCHPAQPHEEYDEVLTASCFFVAGFRVGHDINNDEFVMMQFIDDADDESPPMLLTIDAARSLAAALLDQAQQQDHGKGVQ